MCKDNAIRQHCNGIFIKKISLRKFFAFFMKHVFSAQNIKNYLILFVFVKEMFTV